MSTERRQFRRSGVSSNERVRLGWASVALRLKRYPFEFPRRRQARRRSGCLRRHRGHPHVLTRNVANGTFGCMPLDPLDELRRLQRSTVES